MEQPPDLLRKVGPALSGLTSHVHHLRDNGYPTGARLSSCA
jgi:hypothetical protein